VERLEYAGLELRIEGDTVVVDNVVWDSPAQQVGIDFDWKITAIEVPLAQPDKSWMYLPGLLALGLIIGLQRRRSRVLQATGAKA
jgi:hypothetical protein